MKIFRKTCRNCMPSTLGAKFLAIIVLLIGGLAAGAVLGNSVAMAATPPPAQPQTAGDVDAQTIQYKSGDASISAYLAKPKSAGKHGAVIVVHDVAGLNDAAQEVTRRFAEAGFVALTPNLISRTAAAAKTPQQVYSAIAQLPLLQPVSDLKAAFAFLQQDASVDASKISVIGIGWGGWRAMKFAEDATGLNKVVTFYGTTPADDYGLTNIKAPVLAHYAQYDFRVTGNALLTKKQLGEKFKYFTYAGADRGFLMPDKDSPYGFPGGGPEEAANAEAAKLSWTRTLDFLKA